MFGLMGARMRVGKNYGSRRGAKSAKDVIIYAVFASLRDISLFIIGDANGFPPARE
jgi:hypothetical protein